MTNRTHGLAPGVLFPVGETTETYQVTDAAGHTAQCSFTVTVNDTEPPTVGTPAAIDACYASFAAAVQAAEDSVRAVSNDNCTARADLNLGHAPLEGECATTLTLFVLDEAENGPASAMLDTFVDGEPPMVTCPDNLQVECGELYTPGEATATDNCDPSPQVTVNVEEIPGNCADGNDMAVAGGVAPPPKLTIKRTFTGSDGSASVAGSGGTPCDNTATCTQFIDIFDTTPPVIDHCPEPLVVERGDKICSTAVQDWLDSFAAHDTCGGVVLSNDGPECGFPPGTTTVTFTATDECGNESSCSSTITVQPLQRLTTSAKGSLLIFSKVEIKWNADGSQVLQDTFLNLTNDFPDAVAVQAYFINGDISRQEVRDESGQVIQEAEPGWNTADCLFTLTGDQPHAWSAANGSDKCQPFTVLDTDGPGRPDPETGGATRVLRGFVIMWAVKFNQDKGVWEEIQWNHLQGSGVLVNYDRGTAWEYNAWAAQARCGVGGDPVLDCVSRDANGTCCESGVFPGELALDGFAYDVGFDSLLLDFYGSGSTALSGGGRTVNLDTDLTIHAATVDLRQDGTGPLLTKVDADVWNESENKFSGARRCICCWDQTLASNWSQTSAVPNYFMRTVLGTDKGKARLQAGDSIECDYSQSCGLPPPTRVCIAPAAALRDSRIGGQVRLVQRRRTGGLRHGGDEPRWQRKRAGVDSDRCTLRRPDVAKGRCAPCRSTCTQGFGRVGETT